MDTDTMHVVFFVQRTCGCRQIAPIRFLTVYYNCESLLARPTSRKDRHSTIQSSNSRGLVFAAASPRLAKFSIRRTTLWQSDLNGGLNKDAGLCGLNASRVPVHRETHIFPEDIFFLLWLSQPYLSQSITGVLG